MNTQWKKRQDIKLFLSKLQELYFQTMKIKVNTYQDQITRNKFLADKYTLLCFDENLISHKIKRTSTIINNIPCEWIYQDNSDFNKRILYIHGGAFMGGNLDSHRHIASYLAEKTNSCVLVVDYLKTPEHPFPTALNNCFDSYKYLLHNSPLEKIYSEKIFIVGDSAGGNLAVTLSLKIKDSELPLPRAILPVSPLLDFTCKNESMNELNGIDPILQTSLLKQRLPLLYLFGKHILKVNSELELKKLETQVLFSKDQIIKNPLISPYFGDLSGLPPIYLNVGEIEILRDDSIKFYEKAKASGVDITLKVWKDMIHVFIAFIGIFPEAKVCLDEMSDFINQHY